MAEIHDNVWQRKARKFRITHHIGFFNLTKRLYRHAYVYNLWATCKSLA